MANDEGERSGCPPVRGGLLNAVSEIGPRNEQEALGLVPRVVLASSGVCWYYGLANK